MPDLYTDYRDYPYEAPNLNPSELDFQDVCLRLACSKGVYPYRYMSSFDKMNETRLPEIASFRNDLSASECSIDDYAHAHEVWNTLRMDNLKDYTIFYLCSDILILSDVFNRFRELTMQDYKLDPARFYTSGSLGISSNEPIANLVARN